ncbi:MAG TPA: 4-hydroxy-tetrahydrodipicolinate reductase [Alphaproteobacteria bacterium]|nr:4-hydroxy-tetrahydrodipicolinate reductase [Alphaproteobacteria bacterium]HAJ47577.1 4-hydroxy-tetrahydrodipicolinate reductase [Alphaproteobacteria bacterium]
MPSSSQAPLSLVIAGAAGRMGQAVIRAALTGPGFEVIGALEHAGNAAIGVDLGPLVGLPGIGVQVTDEALPLVAKADAIVDFSTPEASLALADLAAQARIVHVCGTTGFTPAQEARLRAAARHATLIKSGNMSLGVNLLAALVEQAARALPGFDIEIVEMHHNRKVDAPSGTALLLGDAAALGRGKTLADIKTQTREGQTGPRESGTIGFASLRGGTVVGEHHVYLAGTGERLTLSHMAEDRGIFAAGALHAARWGQGRGPGLFSMRDVLNLAPGALI